MEKGNGAKLAITALIAGIMLTILTTTPTFMFSSMLPVVSTVEQAANGDGCYDSNSESSTAGTTTVAATNVGGDLVKNYLDSFGQIAFDVGKKFGLPYEALLGQAVTESGWNGSQLSRENNNFFGMKAVDGSWRKFKNVKEGWVGYGHFMTDEDKAGYYKNVVKHHADPEAYAKALQTSPYCATDNNGQPCQYYESVWGHAQTFMKYIAEHKLFPPSSEANKDFKDTNTSNDSDSSVDDDTTSGTTVNAACKTSKSQGRSEIIASYIKWAKEKAADKSIGYSQKRRMLNDDVDCSSFVYYALTKGGDFDGDEKAPFSTRTAGAQLEKWGFEKKDKNDNPQEGDILLNPSSHVEIRLKDGEQVGAHHDEKNGICADGNCKNGDQTGDEVSVTKKGASWSDWTEIWRLPESFSRFSDGGSAKYGKVGDVPHGSGDYSWMCNTIVKVCKNGDDSKLRHVTPDNWHIVYSAAPYQCVWYAWNRLAIIHGDKGWQPVLGNGNQIGPTAAKTSGWTADHSPRPGDGVSFDYNHVAVVEKVFRRGGMDWMLISEGNYNVNNSGAWNGFNTRETVASSKYWYFRHNSWK